MIEIDLSQVIEDPWMLTQAQQETTSQEPGPVGSTLKQNLTEKLPALNTQVKLSINESNDFILSL